MKRFLISIILINTVFVSLGQVATNTFSNQRIRYQFTLSGNAQTANAIAGEKVAESQYGGNLNQLIDPYDYGTYRYQLHNLESKELLFSKGFSPLFEEWRTTEEAKQMTKEFQQAVFFPRPLIDMTIKIERRNGNSWKTLLIDTIQANDAKSYIQATPKSNKVRTIIDSGKSEEKIDLYFLAEGYTAKEQNLFFRDAKDVAESLFNCAPYSKYKERFNVKAIMVYSQESGTDEPNIKQYKNTALNSSFNTFESERYLTTLSMNNIYDAAASEPWDHIIILVNTSKYGGGGCYNFECISSAHNRLSHMTVIHEFGHAFAALGDEYYNDSETYEESFYTKDIEPWEPNLTTLTDFESKWKKMMAKETPIPTPRESQYNNTIGVFEGGGYETKGVYSPAMKCWMKDFKTTGFCPVCQAAIEKVILSQSK